MSSRNNTPGRKRYKERKRLEQDSREAEFRTAGASCGTCVNRTKVSGIGQTCDLDSDFHGYVRVKMDGLCTRWKSRPGQEIGA